MAEAAKEAVPTTTGSAIAEKTPSEKPQQPPPQAEPPASQAPSQEEEEWRPTNWGQDETPKDRLFRKFKQQPLVPAGCLLTCGALIVASHHLRKGNREQLNRALRWRIYFQGITVVAAMAGLWFYDSNKAAPPPPPVPSTSQPQPSQSAYQNITTSPGRPPTISQVAKEEARQAERRKEWQERFREAQKREDGVEDQRKLEEALLKGTGVTLVGEELSPEEMRKQEIELKRKNRPVIGQDGRDRSKGN
ncbi:unnamed protein product [Sympodiomycopsis kandeliae]